uniref:Uncharacterized protein n=1 Tax=Arundo donax TaxID=35708 RepID=A0A0A9CKL0_ARUDO
MGEILSVGADVSEVEAGKKVSKQFFHNTLIVACPNTHVYKQEAFYACMLSEFILKRTVHYTMAHSDSFLFK